MSSEYRNIKLNIVLICPTYDEKLLSLESLITKYFHSRELTKALSERFEEADWIQAYETEGTHQIGTIKMNLIKARPFEGGLNGMMSEHIDRNSLAAVIDRIKPDFAHITGLIPKDILQVAEVCSGYATKLTASFHGGHPSGDPTFYALQAQALNKLSGILFNSTEQARIWQDAGLVSATTMVAICPETSSFFKLKNRNQVRNKTNMVGDPVCIATARLHPIKDPITMLKGFEQILKVKPDARLYWVFQTDELLIEMENMISTSPLLSNSVQLLGTLDYWDMEDFFNSADFFIQASLQEYGGNSLVEAMACGVIPVATKIPSFRYLTGNNLFGTLFDTGDSEGLARIVTNLPKQDYEKYSKKIRSYFDEFLSFGAIADSIQKVMTC